MLRSGLLGVLTRPRRFGLATLVKTTGIKLAVGMAASADGGPPAIWQNSNVAAQSVTASARASISGGISMPSAFAVF